jgi:hypothetical protein
MCPCDAAGKICATRGDQRRMSAQRADGRTCFASAAKSAKGGAYAKPRGAFQNTWGEAPSASAGVGGQMAGGALEAQ